MTSSFIPGGATGFAPVAAEHTYAPLDWLLQHPSTRKWMSKVERNNVAAAEIIDLMIDLEGGFEGIILNLSLLHKAGLNGINSGTGWRLYMNRIPYYQTRWQFGASLEENGRFDWLYEGNDIGHSFGRVETWLPDGALVEMGINNNGGTADVMGWVAWGAYWPTTLRSEYDVYRRASARRVAER